MREIRISETNAGGRTDKTVMKYLDKAPSGFVYKMLRKKNIVLNGKKASGAEITSPGDIIKLYLADETIDKFRSEKNAKAVSIPNDMIVFEDENIIALNKPAGMLSQRSAPGDKSLNDLLTGYLTGDDLFRPGISNRLDRNTSGIVIAGKNPASVRILNSAIKERKIQKLYICAVKGNMPEKGNLTGYILKNEEQNKAKVLNWIPEEDPDKYSVIRTGFKRISQNDDISLLLVDLITGKSHQIRSHFASLGHPLIGDMKYGDYSLNKKYYDKYRINRQLLHAWKMEFKGMDGILEYLNGQTIICGVPDDINGFVRKEGLCLPGIQED